MAKWVRCIIFITCVLGYGIKAGAITGDNSITISEGEQEEFSTLLEIDTKLKEIYNQCFVPNSTPEVKALHRCICPHRANVVRFSTKVHNILLAQPKWSNHTLKSYTRFSDGSLRIQLLNLGNLEQILSLMAEITKECLGDDPIAQGNLGEVPCSGLGKHLHNCKPFECKVQFGQVGATKQQIVGVFEDKCIFHEINEYNHKTCMLSGEQRVELGDFYNKFYNALAAGVLGNVAQVNGEYYYQIGSEKLHLPNFYYENKICRDLVLSTPANKESGK